MKRLVSVGLFLAAFCFLTFLWPATAHADSAAQNVIRGFYTELVSAMKQGSELGFSGRYKKLEPVIRSSFNLPLMTRVAVGSSWMDASEKDHSDLVAAFSKFSISTYATRFASYDGEEFSVTGEKPLADGVIVETVLKPKDGDPVTLNYLMRKDEKGNYRVVDVYLNGTVSELATRRSEFSSITSREGIPTLVNSLEEKSKKMGAS